MKKSISGKSALTGNGVLLLYYALGILTFVFIFTILIAALGALISRSAAKKEGVVFVINHCTWIFRSIWVFILLLLISVGGSVYFIGDEILKVPDTSNINNFGELWSDPVLRTAVQYTASFALIVGVLCIWFLYRMLRGGFTLLMSRPPVKS